MKTASSLAKPGSNTILGALGEDAYQYILPSLEPVDVTLGDIICEAGGLLTHAYFPEGCVLSLLTVMENGAEIECANIGNEGAFGIFPAMYGAASSTRCLVQLVGPMQRCEISPLRELFHADPEIQDLFVSYSDTVLSQVAQTVGCNALHTIEQRMCRWLLMMHDRAKGNELTYTHEFLARVMGANRTSITHAAQSLQRRGFITYRRGLMQIEDRAGMEAASCECYGVVRARFEEFLFPPDTAYQPTKGGRGR
ncbi:Crp/Fnr family transcriptional regulator [Paracoccus hibiscisoli]|uniref:Crp/Fnr family transcriptional regulator n=1 Tax=Paracoccus hibiscisoli TaxID=2023261 RepID=A0A4U0QE82_9RHOB|nr:Crp/Fnr family transcriptional regulator [Paracoccus hibiscisoli]TJZ79795.1 Crp/Fnr family transcriptional regulator [Paracoccus hibiscisoli]TJZ79829.1 Crp/Fnr family transcriptional regulator [Paracoccus hibiscisoli]